VALGRDAVKLTAAEMLLFVCEIVIVNCKNSTSHQDKDNSPFKVLVSLLAGSK
jgi:hypothetical protein